MPTWISSILRRAGLQFLDPDVTNSQEFLNQRNWSESFSARSEHREKYGVVLDQARESYQRAVESFENQDKKAEQIIKISLAAVAVLIAAGFFANQANQLPLLIRLAVSLIALSAAVAGFARITGRVGCGASPRDFLELAEIDVPSGSDPLGPDDLKGHMVANMHLMQIETELVALWKSRCVSRAYVLLLIAFFFLAGYFWML